MGHHHRKTGKTPRSHTLPSSPTHSSSSSDFEFTVNLSPRKSSATNLCPADDLFYKGQLLPLHLSPRISMVRTLLLSSSSTSSSATTARHSSDSHSSFSCDSSRPSSVAADDDLHLHLNTKPFLTQPNNNNIHKKPNKYFSLSRFSSVFRKTTSSATTTTTRVDPDTETVTVTGSSVKRMSVTAKEVIWKYLKKARNLSQKGQAFQVQKTAPPPPENENDVISQSFSGNLRFSGSLRYPRRRSCVSSCPSSMRSSPSHSGILCRKSVYSGNGNTTSSMDELQSAIQGAIAHCKSSMTVEGRK